MNKEMETGHINPDNVQYHKKNTEFRLSRGAGGSFSLLRDAGRSCLASETSNKQAWFQS